MEPLHLTMTKKQKLFCEATAREVLFGGAAGGGKSYGQLLDALLYALKYPESRQLILRRTFPDLERSIVQQHMELYPLKLYSYNMQAHRGRFANGSVIDFGYLASESDVYQYQGAEYDVIRFDELTQFTESQYRYLFSRLRGTRPYPRQIKCTANPGGVGHAWVKQRFVDPAPPGVEWVTPQGTSRVFLPSRVQDNPVLMKNDPAYLENLRNLDEVTRRALMDGDWDILAGQFFPEFDRNAHVVEPFPVPEHWRRYITLDYGMDMLAAYEIAEDEDGFAWVVRELYEGRDNEMGAYKNGHIVGEAVRRCRETFGPAQDAVVLAPPDLWNRNRDSGVSTAQRFAEGWHSLTKTGNDRVDGWRSVHEWLALQEDREGMRKPRLRIFSSCVNLIRTLPQLQIDARRPEDVCTEPHEMTHAPDALRGFCVFRTRPADRAPEPVPVGVEVFYTGQKESMDSVLGWGDTIDVI